MNKFTVTMRIERETKNAIRYQEVEENGQPIRIGTQYIQKSAFNGATPNEIKLEVSY